jgi:hypothetical protein
MAVMPARQLPGAGSARAPIAFTRLSAIALLLYLTKRRTISARGLPSKGSSDTAAAGTSPLRVPPCTAMPLASSCIRSTAPA